MPTTDPVPLSGYMAVEGAVAVSFGPVSLVDPDGGTNIINVHSSATRLDVSALPADAGSEVSVETNGGTSESLFIGPQSFTDIIGSADIGTPADTGERSANVGQLITIEGSGFRTNTKVVFPTVNDAGIDGSVAVRLNYVSADGTEATVAVPK